MTLYISFLATITLVCLIAAWLIDRSQKKLDAAYNRIISSLEADNLDLRNRMYLSKGQPPVGVDVTKQYQEKEIKRQNGQATVSPIDPLQKMRAELDPPPTGRHT